MSAPLRKPPPVVRQDGDDSALLHDEGVSVLAQDLGTGRGGRARDGQDLGADDVEVESSTRSSHRTIAWSETRTSGRAGLGCCISRSTEIGCKFLRIVTSGICMRISERCCSTMRGISRLAAIRIDSA